MCDSEVLKEVYYLATQSELKQLQNVLVDLGTITSLTQDEEHAQKINQATALSAAELEHTLDRQLDYQQEKAGVAEQAKASVHLYQGDDAAFGGSKAEGLHHYKGGYDTQHNKVYVNTHKTDITHGSDIQKVLFTEQQRKENNSNPFLKDLDDKQQKALAYDRGDRAAKNWERFSGASVKSDPAAVNAWNKKHKDSLATNNEWISQVDGGKVKPRLDMENDQHIRELLKTEEGRKLWRSFVPVVGSVERAIDEENPLKAALYGGLAVVEALPLVKVAKDGIRVASAARKLGGPIVSSVEQQIIKEGGKAVVTALENKIFATNAKLLGNARNNLLAAVENPKLRNLINDLYRPGAKYGSGSSIDAFILEKSLGTMIGGKSHHIKLLNYRTALQRVWDTKASLSPVDRKITKQILNDIQSALSTY